MKSLFFSTALFLFAGTSIAQPEINGGPVNVPADGIVDGVFIQEHIPTKRMIPYEFVREADVIWSRRVWESVDLREKMNHPLYFPFDEYDASNHWVKNSSRWSLWTILKTHILNGDLRVLTSMTKIQPQKITGRTKNMIILNHSCASAPNPKAGGRKF